MELLALFQLIRILCVCLFAVSLGLGGTILVTARQTMRPKTGNGKLGLMWWHILTITVAVWGWEFAALVPIFQLLSGAAAPTYLGPGFIALATLTNVALWLILRVQRGRLKIQWEARSNARATARSHIR